MLLNSVVIVLREVLEAALLLSVLLAASRFVKLRERWVMLALAAGAASSATLGLNMEAVSDLFEGVGQEVVNAVLQYAVFGLLAGITFLLSRQFPRPLENQTVLPVLMAAAVALAIAREGAEILIYISGAAQMKEFVSSVLVGSLVGASIGISVGVLFFYLLLSQPARRTLPMAILLLSLIGAGMCIQATGLLIQADWLAVAGPLWNSSALLSETSLAGQLLYALVGYEASPSAVEVVIYASSLGIMALCVFLGMAAVRKQGSGL